MFQSRRSELIDKLDILDARAAGRGLCMIVSDGLEDSTIIANDTWMISRANTPQVAQENAIVKYDDSETLMSCVISFDSKTENDPLDIEVINLCLDICQEVTEFPDGLKRLFGHEHRNIAVP